MNFSNVFHGVFYSLLSVMSFRLLNAISMIYIAHNVAVELYGELGLLKTSIDLLSLCVSCGMGVVLSRCFARPAGVDQILIKRIVSFVLLFNALTLIAIFFVSLFFSEIISLYLLNEDGKSHYIEVSLYIIIVSVMSYLAESILIGEGFYKPVFYSGVIKGVTLIASILIFIHLDGLLGILWAIAISNMFALLYMFKKVVSCIGGIGVNLKELLNYPWLAWREVLSISVPSFLYGIVFSYCAWYGMFLLNTLVDGAKQNAIFLVANQLKMLVVFLPSTISRAIMPMMTRMVGVGEISSNELLSKVSIYSVWSTVIPCVVLFSLNSEYAVMLFGSEYVDAALVASIVFLSLIFFSVGEIFRGIITSSGAEWKNLLSGLTYFFVFLFFGVSLVVEKGALGLALSMFFSQVFMFFIQVYFVLKTLNAERRWFFFYILISCLSILGVILHLISGSLVSSFFSVFVSVLGSFLFVYKYRFIWRKNK